MPRYKEGDCSCEKWAEVTHVWPNEGKVQIQKKRGILGCSERLEQRLLEGLKDCIKERQREEMKKRLTILTARPIKPWGAFAELGGALPAQSTIKTHTTTADRWGGKTRGERKLWLKGQGSAAVLSACESENYTSNTEFILMPLICCLMHLLLQQIYIHNIFQYL